MKLTNKTKKFFCSLFLMVVFILGVSVSTAPGDGSNILEAGSIIFFSALAIITLFMPEKDPSVLDNKLNLN